MCIHLRADAATMIRRAAFSTHGLASGCPARDVRAIPRRAAFRRPAPVVAFTRFPSRAGAVKSAGPSEQFARSF